MLQQDQVVCDNELITEEVDEVSIKSTLYLFRHNFSVQTA